MRITTEAPLTGARRAFGSLPLLALVNSLVFLALFIPFELIVGTWIRPMGFRDLKRFSIPIGISAEFDTSFLYEGGANPTTYTRDQWGLRGTHRSPREIDALTIGGSTTDQLYIDDSASWQVVAQQELAKRGHRLSVANAGVNGQSTVGHLFNFEYWFPLIEGLRPAAIVFYVGANDVMRFEGRADYDDNVDGSSWRVRSATYQLLRTVYGNLQARQAGVQHGRMQPYSPSDYTQNGLLTVASRQSLARQIVDPFLLNVEHLREKTVSIGAIPIFMTQTAFGWNADRSPPRGRREKTTIFGKTLNFADVAFLHQYLNARLVSWCEQSSVQCLDLANDVAFDVEDYYDYVHNTPRGAAKIGRYLAHHLGGVSLRTRNTGGIAANPP